MWLKYMHIFASNYELNLIRNVVDNVFALGTKAGHIQLPIRGARHAERWQTWPAGGQRERWVL